MSIKAGLPLLTLVVACASSFQAAAEPLAKITPAIEYEYIEIQVELLQKLLNERAKEGWRVHTLANHTHVCRRPTPTECVRVLIERTAN